MSEFAPAEERGWIHLFARSRQQQVILTASVFVIALTVALKNVLLVSEEILIRDMAVYSALYLGFLVFAFRPEGNYASSETASPIAWDTVVVFITLTVLLIYAL